LSKGLVTDFFVVGARISFHSASKTGTLINTWAKPVLTDNAMSLYTVGREGLD
jgi:hypothetical protein